MILKRVLKPDNAVVRVRLEPVRRCSCQRGAGSTRSGRCPGYRRTHPRPTHPNRHNNHYHICF